MDIIDRRLCNMAQAWLDKSWLAYYAKSAHIGSFNR